MDSDEPTPFRLSDYSEAAAVLKVEESWLRRHIKKLPHTKLGGRVLFTDSDLQGIVAMFHHEPGTAAPGPTTSRTNDVFHHLGALRPLPRSKVRRAA